MAAGARDWLAWILKWWNAVIVPPAVVAKRFNVQGTDSSNLEVIGTDNRNLSVRGSDNTNLSVEGDP